MASPRLNRRVRRGLDAIVALVADELKFELPFAHLGGAFADEAFTQAKREDIEAACDWLNERIRKESRHG